MAGGECPRDGANMGKRREERWETWAEGIMRWETRERGHLWVWGSSSGILPLEVTCKEPARWEMMNLGINSEQVTDNSEGRVLVQHELEIGTPPDPLSCSTRQDYEGKPPACLGACADPRHKGPAISGWNKWKGKNEEWSWDTDFEMQGSYLTVDMAQRRFQSHTHLATHPPIRRMSKGFKEGQRSPSQQATPVLYGRHSLCIEIKVVERGRTVSPFSTKDGYWEKCLPFLPLWAEVPIIN